MKRDFDLIRSILIQAEAAPPGAPWLQTISWDGDHPITAPMVAEHVAMMAQFGLIEAGAGSIPDGIFAIGPLTWEGHDFLEAARNGTVWNNVMAQAKATGLAMTIAVVKGLLSKEAMRLAGLGS